MLAEIITIGDEILIGQIVDTNAAWISSHLNDIGVRVGRRVTVADDAEEIESAIVQARSRARIIIVTGGLGPTKDDITKLTVARMFSSDLVRNREQYDFNKSYLEGRGISFNELNVHQSDVPECCKVLPNRNGTAPGMWFDIEDTVLVLLPGVPFEMSNLMTDSVLPLLKKRFALKQVVHKTAITFGIAESVLAEKIADWENALPKYLHLAYLPSPSQIKLRLSAYDVDKRKALAEIERRFDELREIIPVNMIGYESDTVASSVASMLSSRGLTLAVAESCTGGALSAKFTAMAGASDYFKGSVVSYTNSVKSDVLGVSKDDLDKYGAVSSQVAEQMAQGVRRLCGADYAIATTGIAGPSGGTEQKPVGTVWMAVAYDGGVKSQKMVGGKLREQNIERAAVSAINLLRVSVLELE